MADASAAPNVSQAPSDCHCFSDLEQAGRGGDFFVTAGENFDTS
jgi:hypothetical protein